MKKVFKITGIMIGVIVLLIIISIVVLILLTSRGTAAPEDYETTIETGGEIEERYIASGSFEVSHYEEYDWNGFSSEMCIRHLIKLNENEIINDKDNIFYNKVDFGNVGITGHSQGGIGVINAITVQEHKDVYKAAISLSPTNKELAANIEWAYDATKINIPIMLLSGAGGGDDWVITGEQINSIYEDINSNKAVMRRKDTEHSKTLYSADGYATAWFMWHLQGDEEAAKAFVGDSPEIMKNNLYQDQQSDFSNT